MAKQYREEREEFISILRNHRFDAKLYFDIWQQQRGMHSCLRVLRHLQRYEICTLIAGVELMVINQLDNKQKILKRHCLKYLREAKRMAAQKENREIESVKREQAMERGRKQAMKRVQSQFSINPNYASAKECSQMTDSQLRAELNKALLEAERRQLVSKHQQKGEAKISNRPNTRPLKPSLKELFREQLRQLDRNQPPKQQIKSTSTSNKILDQPETIIQVDSQPKLEEKKPQGNIQMIEMKQQVPQVVLKPQEPGLFSKIWRIGTSLLKSKLKIDEQASPAKQRPHIS